jgi:hypothetical protein
MKFHNNCWGLKFSSNGYFHNWSYEEDNGVFIIVLFNGSIWNMKIQSTLTEQGYRIFLNNISNWRARIFFSQRMGYPRLLFSHGHFTGMYFVLSSPCISRLNYYCCLIFFNCKGMSIFSSLTQWAQFIKPHIYKVDSGEANIFNVFGRCHCHIAFPTSA